MYNSIFHKFYSSRSYSYVLTSFVVFRLLDSYAYWELFLLKYMTLPSFFYVCLLFVRVPEDIIMEDLKINIFVKDDWVVVGLYPTEIAKDELCIINFTLTNSVDISTFKQK